MVSYLFNVYYSIVFSLWSWSLPAREQGRKNRNWSFFSHESVVPVYLNDSFYYGAGGYGPMLYAVALFTTFRCELAVQTHNNNCYQNMITCAVTFDNDLHHET